jgi:hypothetical protein
MKRRADMKKKIWYGLGVFLAVLLVASVSECRSAEKSVVQDGVPRVSCDDLKSRLNDGSLVVIDVRQPKEWEESPTRIVGALREDPNRISEWAPKYPKDATLILYCA